MSSDLFDTVVSNPDATFVAIRDSDHVIGRAVRERILSLWRKYEPYSDRQFPEEFARRTHERFWEMYLGCSLLDVGLCLSPPRATGPDFEIRTEEGTIWIEAVAPSSGTGPDAVPDIPTDYMGFRNDTDQIILRLRSAIEEKCKKLERYREMQIVAPTDKYVIAVNGGAIPLVCSCPEPPAILMTLFPIGEPEFRFPVGSDADAPTRLEYPYRPEVTKLSGRTVSTTVFQCEEYAGVSAVFFSAVDPANPPNELGAEMITVHNPLADQKLGHGFFPRGVEFAVDDERIRGKRWERQN